MKIYITTREETNVSYEDIVNLLHESFQERLEQGLKYTCSYINVEQFIEKTRNGIILVAIDSNNNELVGTGTINIIKYKRHKYGYFEYDAISSKYKRKGIASKLIKKRKQIAINNGCEYILSDTSTKATSAVIYHLKNGFKIVGLESYRSTNYYSYVFRMQLKPSLIWNNCIFIKIHFILSYIFIKLTRNIDGGDTKIGKIYKRLCKN